MKIGDKVTIYDDGKPYKNGVITHIGKTIYGERAVVHTETGSDWVGFTAHLKKIN